MAASLAAPVATCLLGSTCGVAPCMACLLFPHAAPTPTQASVALSSTALKNLKHPTTREPTTGFVGSSRSTHSTAAYIVHGSECSTLLSTSLHVRFCGKQCMCFGAFMADLS